MVMALVLVSACAHKAAPPPEESPVQQPHAGQMSGLEATQVRVGELCRMYDNFLRAAKPAAEEAYQANVRAPLTLSYVTWDANFNAHLCNGGELEDIMYSDKGGSEAQWAEHCQAVCSGVEQVLKQSAGYPAVLDSRDQLLLAYEQLCPLT